MFIKQGDLFPPMDAIVKDVSGNVVDVSGGTIAFFMRNSRQPTTIKVNGVAGAVIDGAAGKVRYQWSGTDTDTPGTYEAEFRVTPSGGGAIPMRVPTDGYLTVVVEQKVG